jgi:hypothetical protein
MGKLNIQPISKDKLADIAKGIITESYGWKRKIKSGDIVIIEKEWAIEEISAYIYLSYSDIIKYKYNDILLFYDSKETNGDFSEGLFVRFNEDTRTYCYLSVKSFEDNRMQNKMSIMGRKQLTQIIAIYRYNMLKPQPFTDFMLQTMANHRENTTLIYKSKDFDNIRNI